jgi:membrane protease subunit HflC
MREERNMKGIKIASILFVLTLLALIVVSSCLFVVNQGEYAVVKQFGKVVEIYDTAGLHFKAPLIQTVETLPNKELIYDLPISEVITKDKQTMVADSFALWRITDPKKFITNLNGSVTNAESRIEMLVYNAMKNEISSRTQEEVISDRTGKLASDITGVAKPNFEQYGIELLAVETKHLDLPYDNKESVYNRMISERVNISASYTAHGDKEAQIIKSATDKEIAIMIADANAKAEQLIAEGEAEYMKILSNAYNDLSKAEFYEFVRALDAAKASLAGSGDNVLILDKDSPLVDIFYMSLGKK